MIGTRKFRTIRRGIEKALPSSGNDPIQRLERLIGCAKGQGDRTEVKEDLKRLLESPARRSHLSQCRTGQQLSRLVTAASLCATVTREAIGLSRSW